MCTKIFKNFHCQLKRNLGVGVGGCGGIEAISLIAYSSQKEKIC
jgi:hypothetical protein